MNGRAKWQEAAKRPIAGTYAWISQHDRKMIANGDGQSQQDIRGEQST